RFVVAAAQEILVEIVEEMLKQTARFLLAGPDSAGQPAARPNLGRRRSAIEQALEDPPLEWPAPRELAVRPALGLTVVGPNIEIVSVLRHAPPHPPQLLDSAVHPTEP